MGTGRRTAAVILLVLAAGPAPAGEAFRRLTASEIRARLVGKEVTDEVHWAYRFEPGGRLHVVSLGRAHTARWRIDKDELCLEAVPCVQVWMAGNRVELRRGDGTLPDEGVLQAPARRS
ncbi:MULTISPECIES: hypothetical protein [Methylobacteriaceae]|jgi:hypothetical protein|uniref:Uncharacterized protein n=4 Tax=Methylobacteriaceae TaxID=119045 RepID=A0A509EC97_9HYPH|nr:MULTISPECIES: hypothetical protein [Methylobacteriaceae]MBY0139818.1 hypothetical protein [Methylorubrum populi]MBZ6416266.1 hypothetical protein [Methylobacterium sp.]MDV2987616.1 hypothetical protein [Methylobacteriaceae bacterium AG10]AWB22463.1 hypothetical protein DA075_17370 [Methylobacterium currus]MBD8907320.1 hypothetical protein [Methylorubrum zatmanii]